MYMYVEGTCTATCLYGILYNSFTELVHGGKHSTILSPAGVMMKCGEGAVKMEKEANFLEQTM